MILNNQSTCLWFGSLWSPYDVTVMVTDPTLWAIQLSIPSLSYHGNKCSLIETAQWFSSVSLSLWPTIRSTHGLHTIWSLMRYDALSSMCMVTSSNGNNFKVTGHLCGEFTVRRWIPSTKTSDAELWCFLWSASWINGWVNNREAGDLRRHRAHCDVNVMGNCPYCRYTNGARWFVAITGTVILVPYQKMKHLERI